MLGLVITVYNLEKFIDDTLKSVINNINFKNMYIVCVDDGSIDSSASIIKKYSDIYSNIEYIYKENEGVSIARNIGLYTLLDKGIRYVAFLDGDDLWKLEIDITNVLKSDIDILAFNFQLCDERGNQISNKKSIFKSIDLNKINGFDFIENYKYLDNDSFSSFIYNIDFLVKNNIVFVPLLALCEDKNFRDLSLYNAENIKYYDADIFYYRLHNVSTMHQNHYLKMKNLGQYDSINARNYMINYYLCNKPDDHKIIEFYTSLYFQSIIDTINYINRFTWSYKKIMKMFAGKYFYNDWLNYDKYKLHDDIIFKIKKFNLKTRDITMMKKFILWKIRVIIISNIPTSLLHFFKRKLIFFR